MKVVGVDTIDDALRALRENGGDPVEQVAPKVAASCRARRPAHMRHARSSRPVETSRRFNTMAGDD